MVIRGKGWGYRVYGQQFDLACILPTSSALSMCAFLVCVCVCVCAMCDQIMIESTGASFVEGRQRLRCLLLAAVLVLDDRKARDDGPAVGAEDGCQVEAAVHVLGAVEAQVVAAPVSGRWSMHAC